MLDKEQLKFVINDALKELYKNDKDLIDNCENENTLTAKLTCYIQKRIDGYNVDAFYNRDIKKPKMNSNEDKIVPDIVIHKRLNGKFNLAAMEVKGFWNSEPRKFDEDKLKDLKTKYSYSFIFRIELNEVSGLLIEM